MKKTVLDGDNEMIVDRIEKAEDQLLERYPDLADNLLGFRRLVLDSTNMKDVFFNPSILYQDLLSLAESNIKEDRNDLDLLFGCLLNWGLELSKPYTTEEISEVTVHTYDEDALVACFADDIPEEVIREIARRQPLRTVFRDRPYREEY